MKIILVFLGIFSLVMPGISYSWSKQIHEAQLEIVFQQLESDEKAYYSDIAQRIFLNQKKKKKDSKFTKFSQLGAWADSIREEKLSTLFVQYESTVPDALVPLKNQNTSFWHFHNTLYNPGDYQCRFKNHGQLVEALTLIDSSLKAEITKNQEAVLLALQIHFIQDAHQPLHGMTKLNKNCGHDRGGNLTCVRSYGTTCLINLHQLWDRGFKVSRDYTFRKKMDSKITASFEPSKWVTQSQGYAEFIYSVDENKIDVAYREEAEGITRKLLDQLTINLIYYLKRHYKRELMNARKE